MRKNFWERGVKDSVLEAIEMKASTNPLREAYFQVALIRANGRRNVIGKMTSDGIFQANNGVFVPEDWPNQDVRRAIGELSDFITITGVMES